MKRRTLSLDAFLPYRLSVTANLVSEVIALAYEEEFGLRVAEWRVVAVLGERGESTQQGLATITRMDKMTTSRATATLLERRLVERRPDPNDRRAQILSLTAAGKKLYAHVVPKALELEERLFASLDGSERKDLMRLLARVDAAALEARDDEAKER